MKKVAVLIDGGHLRALARHAGHTYDTDFIVAAGHLLHVFHEEELLKILYYDCAPYEGSQRKPVSGDVQEFSQSGNWLDDLAARQYFAVRRGTLKWRGWVPRNVPVSRELSDDDFKPRFEQKGVDLRLGLDITEFAATGAAERLIVVTGDTDLIPAFKVARRAGLQIVMTVFPGRRVGRELAAHVDILRDVAWPEPRLS